MTARRLTGRRNVLDNRKDEVIAALVSGDSYSVAADRFGVSKAAIAYFVVRHEVALRTMREKVAEAVEDYHIAHKVNRIAALDKLYTDIGSWIKENSLTETTYGEGGTTKRFRADAVNALRGVLKDAATELGQLPKPDVHNTVNVGILVRQLSGYDPEAIG